MAKRIFLHVGTTKSGTTFLQSVLWAHHDRLREDGFLLAGSSPPDHYAACLDVREEAFRHRDPESIPGTWTRFAEEMAAWPGDALVSHELFAPATAAQAERAIAALGDAEVHVVVTARDLVRQVPAEWQEHLKHRSMLSFHDFVQELRSDLDRGPFSPHGYHFWAEQDLPALVSRWGGSLPTTRVHLVTVPQAGAPPTVLWDRYTGLLGVDGEGFDLSLGRSNSSMGAEQTELLRRVNAGLGPRMPLPGSYTRTVKEVVGRRILSSRPGTPIGLVGEDHSFVVARAAAMIDELKQMRIDVVGDLDELLPSAEPAPGLSGTAAIPAEVLLDEAVEVIIDLLQRLAWQRRQARR